MGKNRRCEECAILTDIKELHPGDIVPVWLRNDFGEEYIEFFGRLVRHITSDTEPYPFISKCKKCKRQVNAITEKWQVARIDDRFIENVSFVRNIRKFHSYGVFSINTYSDSAEALLFNEYCVDFLENDPVLCAKLKREIQNKDKGTELLKNFHKYTKSV